MGIPENKIIAEFMGYSVESESAWVDIWRNLNYNENWNYLMDVVEKIEAMDNVRFEVIIKKPFTDRSMCLIIDRGKRDDYMIMKNVFHESKITAIWLAVIAFIEWYNAQNNKDNA